MKVKLHLFSLFFVLMSFCASSQNGFHFSKANKKQERLKFRLINNLIVIPLHVNGKKLSFILDSGVSKTILFNITENDSIGLNNVKTVELRGLGGGLPVEALLSKSNKLSLKQIVSENETIYVILRDYFDLSAKMGTTIHGIIGYNLLKDFLIRINYGDKTITFYNPDKTDLKKCKKCELFPLQFFRKKPYIDAKIQIDTVGTAKTDVKLLIDSGGSDALWLFEHTKPEIVTPKRFFEDILGEGLSGGIYGNRSRIPKLEIGSFTIPKPTVSFLDSISSKNARNFKERNGSIGAGVLRRFIVWFDYPNKRMMLKKATSLKKPFNYNMSGLDVVYSGQQLVKEQENIKYTDSFNQNVQSSNSVKFISSFSYRFKPSFKIKSVAKGSPAFLAGLKSEDQILRLNGRAAHEYDLGEIIEKFHLKSGQKIKMTIERNGQKLKFQFVLMQKI